MEKRLLHKVYDAARFFCDALRFFRDAMRFFCDAVRHQLVIVISNFADHKNLL
ncbi:MAG: hypothetical protein WCR53_04235 [Bacteroidaceae bacterium]